jgi:hypothetical protein
MNRAVFCASALAMLAALGGCGGEEFDTAYVTGKVTCQDKPVPAGTLTFSPVPGDAGQTTVGPSKVAVIKEDGTYEVEAVIGKVNITFSRGPDPADIPELEADAKGDGEAAEDARRDLELIKKLEGVRCNAVDTEVLEIKSGDNTHDIELMFRDPREFD